MNKTEHSEERYSVCTIVTPDYIPFALALFDSLTTHTTQALDMCIFIATPTMYSAESLPQVNSLSYLFIDDLCGEGIGRALKVKYLDSDINAFRWAMKSVLLQRLLTQGGYRKAIFLDGDLFFYANCQFIFDMLEHSRMLLTPHWRTIDPLKDSSNFLQLFNRGIYNAGFVAVNAEAVPILDWWSRACEYKCEFLPEQGLHADQTYLNLMPVYFEGVQILLHKGCNVAAWNRAECPRTGESGSVLIANKFPVVFIHYTRSMIQGIIDGKDALLAPYLADYAAAIEKLSGRNIMDRITVNSKHSANQGYFARGKNLLKRRLRNLFK